MNELQTIMLEHYSKLIHMFKHQFGESCHVVLYSLLKKGKKCEGQAISSSGFLSSIQPGEPLPSFVLEHIRSTGIVDKLSFLNNYYPDFKLRSSLLFIRDDAAKAFACLCVHHDLGHIVKVIDNLEESVEIFKRMSHDTGNRFVLKNFKAKDVQGFVRNVMDEFISAIEVNGDVALLDVDSKLDLIAELNEKGIFEVGGTVEMVAHRLNMSKFRIFRHLDELKAKQAIDQAM